MSIDDDILAAGAQLLQTWKNPALRMPENDLHPRPDAMMFELKVIKDRLAACENSINQIVRHLKGAK